MDERLKLGLQGIIQECLGGPDGGPDSSHYRAAAIAVALLESYGINGDSNNEVDPGYIEWAKEFVLNETK